MIRTRFAPSPTGFLHLGSVRTALFSWLFARHNQGQFILRIEDTDQERSRPEYTDLILEGMNWLGLDWDEGPIFQTQRYDRYRQVIDDLISQGKAYYCHCSKEDLQTMRDQQNAAGVAQTRYDGTCREKNLLPHENAVVRLKVPQDQAIEFEDLLHGHQVREPGSVDDWILMRSDGNPTYNFAVVIDDLDMEITHVIRGDDHLNNTPKQVVLYQLLGAPMPAFCHIPMILDEDGSRLSKRSGSANMLVYREQGYLPSALLNAMVRLGWSHQDQELFSMQQMVELFSLDALQKSAACFNQEKFHWIAKQHLHQMSATEILTYSQVEGFSFEPLSQEKQIAMIELFAPRCKNINELKQQSWFIVQSPDITAEMLSAYSSFNTQIRDALIESFKLAKEQQSDLFAAVKTCATQAGLKMKDVALPLRIVLTGSTESPDLSGVMTLLGADEVIARLKKVSL